MSAKIYTFTPPCQSVLPDAGERVEADEHDTFGHPIGTVSGTVIDPTDISQPGARPFAGHDADRDLCVLVAWDTGDTRWEFADELRFQAAA